MKMLNQTNQNGADGRGGERKRLLTEMSTVGSRAAKKDGDKSIKHNLYY